MSEKIVLSFDKPVQIFEINKREFEVYYDDASIMRYRDVLMKFSDEYDKVKDVNVEDASPAEQEEIKAKQDKLIKEFIEAVFGEGTYELIYASTGKSMFHMLDVVEAFARWLQGKLSKFKKNKHDYYTKKVDNNAPNKKHKRR